METTVSHYGSYSHSILSSVQLIKVDKILIKLFEKCQLNEVVQKYCD